MSKISIFESLRYILYNVFSQSFKNYQAIRNSIPIDFVTHRGFVLSKLSKVREI